MPADLSQPAHTDKGREEEKKNRNFQPLKPKREFVNVTQINTMQDGFLESVESLKYQLVRPPPPRRVGGAWKGWVAAAAPPRPPKNRHSVQAGCASLSQSSAA